MSRRKGTFFGIRINWRRLLGFVFDGVAFVAFQDRNWWLVAVCAAIGLVLTVDLPGIGLRYFARDRSGISMVYPIAPLSGPREKVDKVSRRATIGRGALTAAIAPMGNVKLLLVSGFRIIGNDRDDPGWLTDVLPENPYGTRRQLEVLLLDPDCAASRDRSHQMMPGRQEHYREGCQSVLWTLKCWAESHKVSLKLRLYDEPPIWQMLMLDDELWLLTASRDTATDLSPIWVIRRNEPYGLCWGLEAVWHRRWAKAAHDVDLSTIREPDWSKVTHTDTP